MARDVSRSVVVPTPIGGLNARDALAAMPPNDAVTLDNFFPTPTYVQLRNGYVNWATGLPAHVESLMPYRSQTTSKMFAASGSAFYDVTSQAAVGAAVVTGQSNARWQTVNFGTPGGQYLYCVNGANSPQLYNGSAWQAVTGVSAPIAVTGVTTSLLIQVNAYKSRLFFVETASTRAWYLPLNSVGGAAASLDFAPFFRMGGYLMAIATWTIDNAAGIDEYAVFISSEGEVVVFTGTDPSNAATWTLKAQFHIGKPVGRRCFTKMGSDLIFIGADGFFPLSKALLTDRAQLQDAVSNKILNLVNNDYQSYSSNFGWEATLYPVGNKLLINIPQSENSKQYQYVMNTVSGAWARFTDWNANCFCVLGDSLYFGSNLGQTANSAFVAKCDVGYSDAGAFITGEVKTAFRYLKAPGLQKKVEMVRPIYTTAGDMTLAVAVDVDFSDNYLSGTARYNGTAGTAWNAGAWNTFAWGDVSTIKKDWITVSAVGDAVALHMRCVNNASGMQWQAVEYLYQTGGVL